MFVQTFCESGSNENTLQKKLELYKNKHPWAQNFNIIFSWFWRTYLVGVMHMKMEGKLHKWNTSLILLIMKTLELIKVK